MSEITAELALEIKDFLNGIKKSQAAASTFSKKGRDGANGWAVGIKKLASGIAAVAKAAAIAGAAVGAIGVAVAAGLARGIKSALDMGGKFSDIAAQMGTTAGQARVLAAAFENNGMSADQVATTVNKMSKSMNDAINGLSTSKRAFEALGLDPNELIKDDPAAAFQKIMQALSGIENESMRVAIAMDIFGRSGGKLGVLIKDADAMKNAANLIGGQAELLDEHADEFDRASDVLNQMGVKVQGFFVGVGAKIIEQIMPAIEFINEIDLTGIGERFGASLSRALDIVVAIFKVFRAMSLAEIARIFGVALRLGFSKAINFLWAGLQAVFASQISYLVESFKNLISLLAILSTGDFWRGMLNAFVGISKIFVAAIIRGVAALITELKSKVKGAGKILGDSDEALREVGDRLTDESKGNLEKASVDLAPAFDSLGERMRETAKGVADGFRRGLEGATEAINTRSDESELSGLISTVKDAADEALKGREGGESKVEDSVSPDDSTTTGGGFAVNSRLAGAINTIAGRSANAVIAAEASKTSENTRRTAEATEKIEQNTRAKQAPSRPTPKTPSGSGRFA